MINIAIDGPAGSGKSTVSEILGKGIQHPLPRYGRHVPRLRLKMY